MPQFDFLIIFIIIEDITIILFIYFIVLINLTIKYLKALKFRNKILKLSNFNIDTVFITNIIFLSY